MKAHKVRHKTMFKCQICGKLSSGRMPKDGDSSGRFPRRHNVDGKPCHGNIILAIWTDEVIERLIEPLRP